MNKNSFINIIYYLIIIQTLLLLNLLHEYKEYVY